jgi:hypothetical protein
VVPFRTTWRPVGRDGQVKLAGVSGSSLWLRDTFGLHRLQLSTDRSGLAVVEAEHVIASGSAQQRSAELSRLGLAGEVQMQGAQDDQVLISAPGRLALAPGWNLSRESLTWLVGAPAAAGESKMPLPSAGSALDGRDHFLTGQGEAGTTYALDSQRNFVLAIDPRTRKPALILTAKAWPEGLAASQFLVFRRTCFLIGRTRPDATEPEVWMFAPGRAGGPCQDGRRLDLRLQAGTQARFTAEGDLLLAGPMSLRLIPNLRARAEREARARAGKAEADRIAAEERDAAEARARAAMDGLVQRLLEEEREAAAKSGAAVREEAPEADAPELSDDEPLETKQMQRTVSDRKQAQPTAGSTPSAGDGEWTRVRGAKTRRSPAALPAPQGRRYLPVLGGRDRLDVARKLEKFAHMWFWPRFNEMMGSHENHTEFNNHEYTGSNACRDRLNKLLKSKGITAGDDPRLVHLDGRFFISTKTVRKLARWMLRNTHQANRQDEVDRWVAKGRPAHPGFSFGLYIQTGQSGRENRVVLEIRDIARFLDQYDDGDTTGRWVRDELKAAGCCTGLSYRNGKGLARTQGLRLVLFESCNGVATCHPTSRIDPPAKSPSGS